MTHTCNMFERKWQRKLQKKEL
ncbi:unnamed protein product [Spirodela intermedia]|uniref:Uncharacterized protein n=1 Tax=Spirodela intermedia TaxID=51605 RepID=A0ABN7EAY9_SPIIN|nr:unnamed protein product [Spirodela intermedia]